MKPIVPVIDEEECLELCLDKVNLYAVFKMRPSFTGRYPLLAPFALFCVRGDSRNQSLKALSFLKQTAGQLAMATQWHQIPRARKTLEPLQEVGGGWSYGTWSDVTVPLVGSSPSGRGEEHRENAGQRARKREREEEKGLWNWGWEMRL